MVSEGGPQVLPVGVRKTIQQIREIVGNHSDADIYTTLKETNMDPNETAQKLLHQDPYHEVKRKRDKKKEHQAQQHQGHQAQQHQGHQAQQHQGQHQAQQHQGHQAQQRQGHQAPQHQGHQAPQHQAQQTHQTYQKHQSHQTRQSHQNPVYKGSTASEPKQNIESEGHSVNPAMYSNRNVRRAGYGRNGMSGTGVSREFRIVRDNRGKQNSFQDSKSVESSSSPNDVAISNESVKSPSVTQKPPFGRNSLNGDNDSQTEQPKDGNISATMKKDLLGGQRLTASSTDAQIQPEKTDDTQFSTASSSNSVVGVYSSSSDPVHVPSPDSRPTAKIGAIKREVGVVGAHRQNTETSARLSSSQASSFTNLHLGRESPRSFGTSSKVDQVHNVVSESGLSVSRSFTNNQYGRGHQLAGHQKAPQPNKEWKPKSSQRTSMNGPGVIGSPTNAALPSLDISKDAGRESTDLEEKMSQVNLAENQNVILASNIRAPDQFRLVFGSLDPDLTLKSGFQAVVGSPEELPETSARLQILSPPEPSHNEAVNSKPQDLVEDHARNSGTDSPASASVSDNQLNDKKEEVSSSTNLDNYGDIRLDQDHNVAYGSQEAHQHQEVSELQTFQAPYDHNQHAYEMSYFPTIDEHVRAQSLPSPQEVINSHNMSSSMAMVQQQQQQQAMAQMYPQVHYNMMPYRQYPTAVYVPQMVPSYSSNPTYPHPSNGGNYVLMPPGNNSHVAANGLKYGIQQFKPVPPGNPTPFGSYTTPAGYTPGVVGSAPGLEDPSRLKYKDNFYLPNPQAETSEIWMNTREMQPGSYYNMPNQAPPHAAAYMPSPHAGHASYNPAAAAAHSSHMQYPGIYHPTPQAAAMPSPHHMGPAMGGNIGVAAAATVPQVGAYQQPPQLGPLGWPGSF